MTVLMKHVSGQTYTVSRIVADRLLQRSEGTWTEIQPEPEKVEKPQKAKKKSKPRKNENSVK